MPSLHGLDRILARLHTIKEVPHMIEDRGANRRAFRPFLDGYRKVDLPRANRRIFERFRERCQPALGELNPAFGSFETDAEAPFGSRADQFNAIGIFARNATVFGAVKRSPGRNHSEPKSSNSTGPLRSVPKAHWTRPLAWAPMFVVCPPE